VPGPWLVDNPGVTIKPGRTMSERFTISLEQRLAEQFDRYIKANGYTNRSEAVRDLIRVRLAEKQLETQKTGHCVATLTYVYNHHELDLARRLMEAQHAHHELTLATQHVHIDHDNCLETVMLKGPVQAVHAFAQAIIAERGVRHGNLHLIAVNRTPAHTHGGKAHSHSRPVT
jgi:CopG family nickel-responsive transcriptional regulator